MNYATELIIYSSAVDFIGAQPWKDMSSLSGDGNVSSDLLPEGKSPKSLLVDLYCSIRVLKCFVLGACSTFMQQYIENIFEAEDIYLVQHPRHLQYKHLTSFAINPAICRSISVSRYCFGSSLFAIAAFRPQAFSAGGFACNATVKNSAPGLQFVLHLP